MLMDGQASSNVHTCKYMYSILSISYVHICIDTQYIYMYVHKPLFVPRCYHGNTSVFVYLSVHVKWI